MNFLRITIFLFLSSAVSLFIQGCGESPKDKQIREYQSQISSCKSAVNSLGQEISSLRNLLHERDKEIEILRNSIQEKDKNLAWIQETYRIKLPDHKPAITGDISERVFGK